MSFGCLLKLIDLGQVILLKLIENALQVIWVGEVELIFVEVLRGVDQAEIHQLLETNFPLLVGNLLVDPSPFVGLLLNSAILSLEIWLSEEGELHLDSIVDILVILEDDVIIQVGVLFVSLDPA